MNSVRYQVRECRDQEKIEQFLCTARIGNLGLVDGKLPYVVPLNYVWTNGKLYFHGAGGGRRNQIMSENPEACFTVCEEYGTLTDPVPAKTDTAYMSVMIFGKAELVSDLDEATEVLQVMIDKYVPGYYNRPLPKRHVEKYRSSVYGSAVQVYRIEPSQVTAKESPIEADKLFKPGIVGTEAGEH
ncbi:pyridoxamine 5'-phosphate oxidase family protein [Paenibacillus eucommiae]|uniref:Nitroimidazol reductase NimA-like FMN-containing flavoprotein (Pyridoxamine 5'-phosphate oxidase superfamily) n=1 Tax=Paenibacillus eucommiae TaxID=1355755 RepID=A0ABS4J5K7_9BACL|nr:pyridoxamine 5'-phosphate oxidase family protein [Paenibacillus eucommiae]MBP1995120.1 nitroimidazol reductase NimA-like FMN-containing flavoprotein (pyridoxamine 5'-phosphate oxidase superfamily) [Paenibacillus eucommiae]